MDQGKTTDHQPDADGGKDSAQADITPIVEKVEPEVTITSVPSPSSGLELSAPDAVNISEESDKGDTSSGKLDDSAPLENVSSTDKGEVTQSKTSDSQSETENKEEIKETDSIAPKEFGTSMQNSSQDSAISRNTDPDAGALEGSTVVETVKETAALDALEHVIVATVIHNKSSANTAGDLAVTTTVEDSAVAENVQDEAIATADNFAVVSRTVEDLAVVGSVEDTAVAENVQDEAIAAADNGAVISKTVEDPAVVGSVEDRAAAETSKNSSKDAVTSRPVEVADEGTRVDSSLLAGDHERCPVSPSSDREVDLSDDKILHIDESGALHSVNVTDVSHTSSGTVNAENTPRLCEITGKMVVDGVDQDEGMPVKIISSLASIKDSIERCISNNMSESDDDSQAVSPMKQLGVAKPHESERFPRNYGFKIITNRIDLCSSKPAASKTDISVSKPAQLGAMPKLEASGIPLKKIKIHGKPVAEVMVQTIIAHEKALLEKNDEKDAPSLHKDVAIAVQKSNDDVTETSPPKERPTTGLKVRNVESINAAIRKASSFSEDANKVPEPVSNDKLPEPEMTNATDPLPETEMELPVTAANKFGLRAIAPKCEPIASNDPQAIKLIRDLIQLPSMPVYVPDISDSKHFNGRLHLCHGCGDRFVLLKSLLEHQNRRSCVIKFQCLRCDSAVLCFFNRCEFIRHLYNHNQTLTTVMLQYHIVVERLPPNNSCIFDVKVCQECKVFLKVPLPEHMQGLDVTEKKAADLTLKCQWCSLLLPTKCAYQAHRRMHFLQPLHVCPECGDMSPDLPSFNVHINSVCFHTSKRSLFMCTHCKAEMYDARKLERHIRNKHIRDVFKCNFCFVACFNMKDLDKHRRQHHGDLVAAEEEDDDESGLKYAFHLCDMCPNRLIRRVRLGQHVWDHTYANNDVYYVYECRKCKVSFDSKDALSTHAAVCSAASANTQAFATVVTNGGEMLVQQPHSLTSELFVVDGPPPLDANPGIAVAESDFPERDGPEMNGPQTMDSEDNVTIVEEAPPPLQRAPVPLKVTQPTIPSVSAPVLKPVTQSAFPRAPKRVIQPVVSTAPLPEPVTPSPVSSIRVISKSVLQVSPATATGTAPEKKKKKKAPPKKSQAKAEFQEANDDNCFNSFENELFMDADDSGEGGMEVVLNCLECGTNLTSELGSYCTLCEQKREAGTQSLKPVGLPNQLLPANKKAPKKLPISGGNFTCRICNDLISRTCDRAAIKRHFITKHKEIFIAALQTGMNANPNGPKLSKSSVLASKRTDDSPSPKKSPTASASKVTKKKRKSRKPIGGHVSQSDTDDSVVSTSTSPTKDKKAREKRKKSYSPTFPALEAGMVASEERGAENRENVRFCYKCSFKSSDRDEFMSHVATHKTNPKDLQCPACGMCFVVRPSLEKHLVISHAMKNVYAYLLEHGFPPIQRNQHVDTEMLQINQCRVCHSKFDSEAMLEKHFRTHGSAFLLSKQLRRS